MTATKFLCFSGKSGNFKDDHSINAFPSGPILKWPGSSKKRGDPPFPGHTKFAGPGKTIRTIVTRIFRRSQMIGAGLCNADTGFRGTPSLFFRQHRFLRKLFLIGSSKLLCFMKRKILDTIKEVNACVLFFLFPFFFHENLLFLSIRKRKNYINHHQENLCLGINAIVLSLNL